MLINQRKQWNENFKLGQLPQTVVLDVYRQSRNTLKKKLPQNIEELCAYALYLEELKNDFEDELNNQMSEKRNYWNSYFISGSLPSSTILKEYRVFRNSESKRSTRLIEELCEYIIYLENLRA